MDLNYQYEPASLLEGRLPYGQVFGIPVVQTGEEIASAQDYAVCRRIMRAASNNYSSASNYLPADRALHVEALYALMRVGDDRVDLDHSGFSSPMEAIDTWEREYWQAFDTGSSPDPVLRAYLDTSYKFGIPPETMSAYFRAMREDLSISRYPTFDDLLHYIDGSAIPVGRAMTYILGVRPSFTISDALPGADSLSIAMQLSNFWRDVGEDWLRGRVYLPLEDMDSFRYSEANLSEGRVNDRLVDLLEFQFERTESYYRNARQSVPMLDAGRLSVMGALEIYRAILPGIRTNRYDVFTRRAGTNRMQKLCLVMKAYLQIR
jgi:phytoene synthase